MDRPSVSVVVPAYDEGASIEGVVREAHDALAGHGIGRYEIVLVDDGSRDDTAAVMHRMREALPGVRVIGHEENRGLGAAIRTGLTAAVGEVLLWVPGDGQYAVRDLLPGLSKLDTADLVVGLRHTRGDPARGVISRCFHALILLLFRFDASRMSGLFIIRKDVLEQLRPRSIDVFLNYEIPLLCVHRGRPVAFITLPVRPRQAGVSKVVNARTIGRILWEMGRLRVGMRR
jgi:dolichol-phosphate mannosyltransferase